MPKKTKIREMFNNIAGDYDKLNHIMSLDIDKSWRRKAIRIALAPTPEEVANESTKLHVLDLACGTGDFSIQMAKTMKKMGMSHGRVTGVDLSEGMLEVMKGKVEAEGLGDCISMEVGDGENLHFGSGIFDRVTIAFGIRNFEDKEAGIKEMLRVLKPGGRMAILELSLPKNKIIRKLFSFYFFNVASTVGGKVSGQKGAYKYLPASVANFPQPEEFMAIMQSCGVSNVSHKSYSFGICRLFIGYR